MCWSFSQRIIEKVPLSELDSSFKSRDDVRRYYEDHCEGDILLFSQRKIVWVQAFLDQQLVGWVSFETQFLEKNSVFVRNLVVSPKFQRRGIGKKLLFSIKTEKKLFPQTQSMYLIARKVNRSGLRFYQKLGSTRVFRFQENEPLLPSSIVGFKFEFQKVGYCERSGYSPMENPVEEYCHDRKQPRHL